MNIANISPRQKWVDRIAAAWREQVPSIFETGNLLESAKSELAHGEWLPMVRDELPFNRATAHKLIAISECGNLRNVSHGKHLPPSWTILYELTKLTEEQFESGIKSGAINPKMERKDVKVLRGIEPKQKKQEMPKRPAWSVDRVQMWLHSTVLEAFDDLQPESWPDLIATLKHEVAELEKIIAQKGTPHAA